MAVVRMIAVLFMVDEVEPGMIVECIVEALSDLERDGDCQSIRMYMKPPAPLT